MQEREQLVYSLQSSMLGFHSQKISALGFFERIHGKFRFFSQEG